MGVFGILLDVFLFLAAVVAMVIILGGMVMLALRVLVYIKESWDEVMDWYGK